MHVLVTGAAGYIGTHTLVALAERGHTPVALDNYSNSHPEALRRVESITGRRIPTYEATLPDRPILRRIFDSHPIEAVIHLAGLKAVGESFTRALDYHAINIGSTLGLLEVMRERRCFKLVFSSSATVYAHTVDLPIREDAPLAASNPYGRTKLFAEEILRDVARAEAGWQVAMLRYFNPIGAHPTGRIGEDPRGIPNNLLPYISRVAMGKLKRLSIFGSDYPTKDGTGVRDYIHICDLAEGHIAALEHLAGFAGAEAINLGTGRGHSVLEVVAAFEAAAQVKVSTEIVGRRSGDAAACFADVARAKKLLGWSATRSIEEACVDLWRWQRQNPDGYGL